MIELTLVPTVAEVEKMKAPALVEAWNRLAVPLGRAPVKRFATREDGVKRISAVVRLIEDAAKRDAPTVEVPEIKNVVVPAKPAPAPKKVGGSGRPIQAVRAGSKTISGVGRDLILASGGDRTEAELVAAIRAEFPDKYIPRNVAEYYRGQLVRRGENPPPFKAGA